MGQRHPNVTHIKEVEARVVEKGKKFAFTGKKIAAASGAAALGCGYFEVPPGRSAFPNHYHCANEEGVFILEGQAEARIGKDTVIVGQGDYIAYPVGPEFSHSIKNTGTIPLKYLCLSTMLPTEVVGYPDSKKLAAVGCADPKTGVLGAKVRFIIKEQPSVDYYEGEEIG
jgi:uncharacterized cupin superfamily protein